MSSDTRGVSEAETRSSALPSHPVMFNDSDMDEASRSVSPEPLTQKKVAAKHAPSEGALSALHSNPSSSSYPEGYSSDGIPPVLITDHVTPGEQAAATSVASSSDSAANPGSIAHHKNSSQQPSALTDTVPAATDKGFADPPAINTTIDRDASQSGTIPISPSKSPSFLSRVFNTFLGSSAEPSETTAPRGYSDEAPSASWGRPSEALPVEHIKEAGAIRAAESGLDKPTATKHAGLDARSNDGAYQQSVPNTAVAAAEALVHDKSSAQHDTAVAAQHAPHSPGRSESEYFGTPQTSPGDHTTTRSPGHDELHHGQPHHSSDARRELNLSAPLQGSQPHEHFQEPLSSSQQSSDARDMAYTDSFQTARSHVSEEPHTSSTGMIGSGLGAVGLGGEHEVKEHGVTQTTPHSDTFSNSSNTGVLGSLKAAIGLGDNITGSPQHASGNRYSSDRPAWASGGVGQAPARAGSPVRQAGCSEGYNSSAATGANTGAGDGSHNTASLAETVKSYIPGTEANRESHYEQGLDSGHDASYTGSGSQGYSSGTANQGYSSANQGYSSGNTGSSTADGGLLSYIPGTEANRQSRVEQGQDPIFSSGDNTGSNTGGVMSYIPGTEANRESRAEHGQGPSTFSAGNNTGSNTGGVMSYIPGTEANIESRAEHGQGPSTFSSGNKTGSNTGGGLASYIPGTNRESRAEHGQAASTDTVGTAKGTGSTSHQSPIGEAKHGEVYGQPDTHKSLSSSQSRAPVSASTAASASHSSYDAGEEGNHAQAHIGSGLAQNSAAPQLSSEYGSSAASGNTAEGTGHRVYGEAAETQGTGVLGKLKAAVGVGSGADTAAGAHSSWSTTQNPAFDSDTPRSGVGAPTAFTEAQPTGQRRSLSNAPPSASWGSSAQTVSYVATQALPGGEVGNQSSAGLQDSAVRGSSSGAFGTGAIDNDSSNTGVSQSAGQKGFAATPLDRDSPEKGVTASRQQHIMLMPGATGGLGKDSAVKESTSAGQGTGLVSKDSPKAVTGIRGKTPVEQSSGAFTEDNAADSSAAQTTPHSGTGKEPLKLGTTAAQHASTRSAGSASPTAINSPSAAFAGTGGASGPSAGQAGPRLGTTAFEHALSRTSGKPLNRPSGTPGSPQTSFKGPSASASDPASGGMQGNGRTTSELPVSTSAPPASARSTQDSAPVGPATTAAPGPSQRPTQPKTVTEEPVTGKSVAQKPAAGTAVGDGKKRAGPAGPEGAVGTTGTTGPTGPVASAKTTNGAAKPASKGRKGCFACFGGNSSQE